MPFLADKDLALCGLACPLCTHTDCPGCKESGCAQYAQCKCYRCANEKQLDGCYQCDNFPCDADMLKPLRHKAFNRYAKLYGKQALLERLKVNSENGIVYHTSESYKGDYDAFDSEQDVMRLIRFGSADPYKQCPVLTGGGFTLRLVRESDAAELLECYSDPKAQALFNADNCTSDFCYNSLEQMQQCVNFFIDSYAHGYFVRFAIEKDGHVLGTIEMFGNQQVQYGYHAWGVLRLDIASQHETEAELATLLDICVNGFYLLFNVECMITKALPCADERIKALEATGFAPLEGKADYFIRGL